MTPQDRSNFAVYRRVRDLAQIYLERFNAGDENIPGTPQALCEWLLAEVSKQAEKP